MDCIFLLQDMKMTPETLMEHKIFHTEPYHRGQKARQFFEAVKTGKYQDVKEMISEDKFIIYEFDTSE